jgi:dihydropteroate synthase
MLESVIVVDDIDNRAANILKQDALSCGADAVISSGVSNLKPGNRARLLRNFEPGKKTGFKLKEQPFGLKELSFKIKEINKEQDKRIILCRNKKIKLHGKTPVRGL